MSWKLDNIAFEDYGVYVSKSSGVLDLPQISDNSTDWLDKNGRDFWQNIEDVKYEEREIVLSCWVRATGYESFKTKVYAFYEALTRSGKRTLLTPFGNEIEVSLQNSVQLTRKSSYVSNLQLGIFTLHLTVSGDSKTKLITVYRMDGMIRGVFKIGSDAKLTKNLMGSDEITFSLELNYMADNLNSIAREDYVVYEGAKYITLEHPEVTKYSSNKYVHSCTLQHEFFRMKDVQFRVNGESDTYWYATADDVLTKIVDCCNALFPGKFAKGTVASTIYKNHQFQDEDCYTVLSRIAEDYELEFDHKTIAEVITISIVQQVGNATGLTLNYGKGHELSKIKLITSGLRDKMVTRLYAYGAEKNLPVGYGSKRLKLATEPLVKDFYGIIREVTKKWDDIYPERTGTVTSYSYTAPTSADKPETAKYEVADTSMPFDLKAKYENGNTIYLISGTTAKMHFNKGDLAGFEFEIKDYNHTTKTFTLTPIKNDDGSYYPNEILKPVGGDDPDEYVLLDINLPQSYIDDAEARLLARAQEYINLYYQPIASYECDVHPSYSQAINAGDVIFISDADFTSETDPQRVSQIVKNLYLGGSTITISQILKLSNRQLLERRVSKMEQALNSVALTDVNDQRNSQKTVGELSNKILNPLDEMLNADEIVRKKSIDPFMLSEDASTLQYSVVGALVSATETKVTIEAGTFISHNWNAKTRKEIAEL